METNRALQSTNVTCGQALHRTYIHTVLSEVNIVNIRPEALACGYVSASSSELGPVVHDRSSYLAISAVDLPPTQGQKCEVKSPRYSTYIY